MTLKYPYLLLLLLIYIPLILYWVFHKKPRFVSLSISSLNAFKGKHVGGRAFLIPLCRFLELVALGALIVALARPQKQDSLTNSHIYGTDIVLAIDISGSMTDTDIKPSRIEAAKKTAIDFIRERKQDQMGIVIFSGEAISIMPLTSDLMALENTVNTINSGLLEDGTAIGDGLVSAINRVLNGQAVSKSIILLTDGANTAGTIDPLTAAEIAQKKGIKIYAVGIGLDGQSVIGDPYGYRQVVLDNAIDEETLTQIADLTGGKFFRVTDSGTMEAVFKEIDSLEKTSMDVESVQRTEEAFMPWVLIALACMTVVLLIRFTILTKIP